MTLTADGWVRWYAARATELGAPGQCSIVQHGRIYDSSCTNCGYTLRMTKTKGVVEPTEVCGGCGRAWSYQDTYRLRVIEQKRRRRGGRIPSDDHLVEFLERYGPLAQVDGIIARMYGSQRTRWPARIYFPHALGVTTRELEQDAPDLWPRAPFSWYHERIVELARDGRRAFTRRLEHAGCWVRRAERVRA